MYVYVFYPSEKYTVFKSELYRNNYSKQLIVLNMIYHLIYNTVDKAYKSDRTPGLRRLWHHHTQVTVVTQKKKNTFLYIYLFFSLFVFFVFSSLQFSDTPPSAMDCKSGVMG